MNLPIQSHEQKLERKSYRHLLMLFEEDFHSEFGFIVSEHKSYDYGVDCNLELKFDGKVTNFNCHVQLKAIDKLEKTAKNTDDSYSIQIKTSNINYLLNTPKSLYILYVNSKSEFYYAWADESISKLFEKDKDWLYKPSKKSLRFYNKIDKQALLDIYNEIRKQAKLFRKVSENLSGYNNAILPKSSNLIINMDNFEVKSENEIIKFIEENGEQLLNQRNANLLIEMSEKLTGSIKNKPLVCLILGIANFNVGKVYDALSYIMKANNNQDLLDQNHKATVIFYEANIKHYTGLINNIQLEEKLSQIENKGHLLYLEFMKTQKELRESSDDIENILKNATGFVEKMKKFSNEYPNIYLQSKIHLLRVEGVFIIYQVGKQTYNEEKLLKLFHKFDDQGLSLVKEIRKYGDDVLLAIFYQTYFWIKIENLYVNYNREKSIDEFEYLEKPLNFAIDVFRKHNNIMNQCISILTKFKLYKYFEKEAAKEVRAELFQLLDSYGIDDLKVETTKFEEFVEKSEGSFLFNLHLVLVCKEDARELHLQCIKTSEIFF